MGQAIGAAVKWLPPAAGGAPVVTYELSSRPALTFPNGTMVPLSAYGDDDVAADGESAWVVASAHIKAVARTEAVGVIYYDYYVPRLACGGRYVFRIRAFSALRGYGPGRLVDAPLPTCPPTSQPTLSPTQPPKP